MQISNSLAENLRSQTLLFDTCVLSAIRNNIKKPDIQNFLETLDKLSCKFVVTDLVKLEFLRDANKHTEIVERKTFINTLCQRFFLPVTEQMYLDAMALSYTYIRHQIKGVDLVDLINTAFLKKFSHSNRLILTTLNHVDYPTLVHDRLGTTVLDLEKTLATVGFYTVNQNKWDEKLKELVESTEWNS